MRNWPVTTAATLISGACACAADPPVAELAYLKGNGGASGGFFGYSAAMQAGTAVIGAPFEHDHEGQQSGAVYLFERRGAFWIQQERLLPAISGNGDRFGHCVALSGNTLVVGAVWEDGGVPGVNGDEDDDSAINSGAAYVFVRGENGTWSQQAYLKASSPGSVNEGLFLVNGDEFGTMVAISGDTIVVGASGEDSAATGQDGSESDDSAKNSGAVYVFVRDGTTWSQQAYLKPPNTSAGDFFGRALAIDGDTLAVGATGEDGGTNQPDDNSRSNSGAAYVFARSGSDWNLEAYIKAPHTDADDLFGRQLALSGDTLVVTAPGEDSIATGVGGNFNDNSAPESGAAFVYQRGGSEWSLEAYLKAHNTAPGDDFGWSVALDGNSIVVGAIQADFSSLEGSGFPGVAYHFVRDEAAQNWRQEDFLAASNAGRDDNFGHAVAVSGSTLLVGAHQEDGGTSASGAVYIFGGAAESIEPISSLDFVPAGLCITMPIAFGRKVGIEYSPDLSAGSWVELGNFFESGGVAAFTDPDFIRLGRGRGFYRAFLRPQR